MIRVHRGELVVLYASDIVKIETLESTCGVLVIIALHVASVIYKQLNLRAHNHGLCVDYFELIKALG